MKSFGKEFLRSISRSRGRFIAIMVIAALGTGLFAGLQMTAPDMRLSADQYYDGTNCQDIRITTTLGVDDEMIEELGALEGVAVVVPERETDVAAVMGDVEYSLRVHSLDIEAAAASDTSDQVSAVSDDEDYVNRPILVEGEWPSESGECVIGADTVFDTPVEIGDTITFVQMADDSELGDTFETTTYTVTGFVRSSYYLCTSNLGSTTLGDGAVDDFIYIPEEDFVQDNPYTGAFLIVEGAAAEISGTDAYQEIIDEVAARIEDAEVELVTARYDRVVSDAQAEIDDAISEYEDGEEEAQNELEDAQAELEDAKGQLDDAEAELSDAEVELEDAAAELEVAEEELSTAEETLASTKAELEAAEEQIAAGESELEEAQAELAEAETEYEAGLAEYEEQEAAAYEELDAQQAQLDAAIASGLLDEASAAAAQAELDAAYEEAESQLAAAKAELDAAAEEIAAGQVELDAASEELAVSTQQVEDGWAAYDEAVSEYEAGVAEYEEGLAEYEAGLAEYEEGYAEYEEGLEEYEEGQADYDEAAAEVDEELADAWSQIEDAQDELDEVEVPELYQLDRTLNVGMASYNSDASRIANIANVFPLFFFLVAALVTLTTMTRMVDEERTQIGTYKALGYSNGKIVSKYLLYALIASGVGSAIGILILTQVLPYFIMNAYAIMYELPETLTPIDPAIAIGSTALCVGIVLAATAWAAVTTLRETPAALMSPPAPKAGKRILLERVGPLWSRVSFLWKVTCRNIFRYKKRLVMSLIGIAGCTALLLTGLGLNDAIDDILALQYEDDDCLFRYNYTVMLDDDISDKDLAAVEDELASDDDVSWSTQLRIENVVAKTDDYGNQAVTLTVPEDTDEFCEMVTLQNRTSGEELELADGSAVVSEKLAKRMGLSVGDTFTLYEQDAVGNPTGSGLTFTVGGICENYVYNYVYVTPADFEAAMGETYAVNYVYLRNEGDEEAQEGFTADLLDLEGVSIVTPMEDIVSYYRDSLKSVDAIVWILVISAAVLAFVVVYNLNNINIDERVREIATLKVLGFNKKEVNDYIFRETMVLAVLGAFIGLFFGIFLCSFVVQTAEVDIVMFGRTIHASSFAWSFALTLVFAGVVSLFMRRKLQRISMVESLKSVD